MSYYPYGDEKGTVTAQERVKYATYWRDGESGLDYAWNRYYSSPMGRFLSPDPAGWSMNPASPGSFNRYAYVGNDPVNRYDLTGLDWWDDKTNTLHSDPPGPIATVWSGIFGFGDTARKPQPYLPLDPSVDLEKLLQIRTTQTARLAMEAAVGALDAVGQADLNSTNCQKDLKKLGVTAADIKRVAQTIGPVDAATSNAPVSAVSSQEPDSPGETVANFFAVSSKRTTLAGTKNNVLYISTSAWADETAAGAFGTVLHETLHFLGKEDDDIGRALVGEPVSDTDVYSTILGGDCFHK